MTDNGSGTERFELRELVGSGGMGEVWLAWDPLLKREVAIKKIQPPESADDAERADLYARAIKEARAAAQINHPNVVHVYDVLARPDGQPWIIMELVEGCSLEVVIHTKGSLSPVRVAEIMAMVLKGLCAAHAKGVLHRDIKPGNVMITPDGQAKLTDFGIAKLIGDPQLTAPGRVLGTPAYMSPEQARGEEPTAASDLFLLGATMFAVFRRHGPFHRDGGVTAALDAARYDDPPMVPEAGPLADLIHGLLSRDPKLRPTAARTEEVLDAVIRGAPSPVVSPAGRFPAGMAPEDTASVSTRLSGQAPADMPLEGPPKHAPGRHRRADVLGASGARRLGKRLPRRARRWRLAIVVSVAVAVAVCTGGVITGLRLTGGAASDGFQLTAAVNGTEPEAFAVTNVGVLEDDLFRNGTGSGWQPLPGGGRYLGTPATVIGPTGLLEVFARATSGTIVRYYQSAPGADSWRGPEQLGSQRFTSDPSAVYWPGHGLFVFARLTDGLLGIDTQAATGLTASWSGWQSLGTAAIGQPVAAANNGGHPEVFAIASGGSLVHAYNQGNGWSNWSVLVPGGVFADVPTVSMDANKRLEMLVRTRAGDLESLWQEHPGYGNWNFVQQIGSGVVGDPELIAVGGQLEAFAEHVGGSLWYSTQQQADSASWSAWEPLPGQVTGVPAVVYASGRTDILANVGGSVSDIDSVGTSGWSSWRPLSEAS